MCLLPSNKGAWATQPLEQILVAEFLVCESGVGQRLARTECLFCRHQYDTIQFGRGDATVGNPHRAQIYQFELFELVLLSKLDKQFPVERFEAALSQSIVPSPFCHAR